MRNAFVLNIYEKTIVIEFINIEEDYHYTNPKKRVRRCVVSSTRLVTKSIVIPKSVNRVLNRGIYHF